MRRKVRSIGAPGSRATAVALIRADAAWAMGGPDDVRLLMRGAVGENAHTRTGRAEHKTRPGRVASLRDLFGTRPPVGGRTHQGLTLSISEIGGKPYRG